MTPSDKGSVAIFDAHIRSVFPIAQHHLLNLHPSPRAVSGDTLQDLPILGLGTTGPFRFVPLLKSRPSSESERPAMITVLVLQSQVQI